MKAPRSTCRLLQKKTAKCLLLVLSAAMGVGLRAGTTLAQGSIPALRGTYQGTADYTKTNCPGFSAVQGLAPMDITGPVQVNITAQAGGDFGGQADNAIPGIGGAGGVSPRIFLTGTVGAGGALQGTYEWGPIQAGPATISSSGTFTGQFDSSVVPKTLNLSLNGTITAVAFGASVQCSEAITIATALLTASGASADLAITGSGSPTLVATGATITYTLTVSNAGPDEADSTLVVNPAPPGAVILAAASSQGICSTTPIIASCSLGTVPNQGTAGVTITAVVTGASGTTLIDSPNVSSATFDPNTSNNSTAINTPVAGGAVVQLNFNQQASSSATPTPAPLNLQASPARAQSSESELIAPAGACTLTGVHVYESSQPNVQAMPANLFTTLPPSSSQVDVPVPPSGSSFVVTNLWSCGGSTIESGVSIEVDVPAGPTISSVKATGKLKILGSGFNGQVQVFVDGEEFVKAAVLADSTLLVQKGPLTNGTAIAGIGSSKPVLVTVRNGDGGFASFIFKRP